MVVLFLFQSTYLYKVRLCTERVTVQDGKFQSTYLYKVRLRQKILKPILPSFNPRTYIRYDGGGIGSAYIRARFNPRTYIRYDLIRCVISRVASSFNPRTYIRYD